MEAESRGIRRNHNRWVLAIVAFASLVFFLAGVGMFIQGLRSGTPRTALIVLMGFVNSLFFIACLRWSVATVVSGAPAIRIDADGVLDNTSVASAGFIAWNEIAGAFEREVRGKRSVCVVPVDMDRFLNRLPPWKRAVLRSNLKMQLPPITLSTRALGPDFDKAWLLIEEYVASSARARPADVAPTQLPA